MAIDYKKFFKTIHDDPEFYLQNFLKIRTKGGNLESFHLNKAQRKCFQIVKDLRKKNKPIRLIWLKARQLGISTFCEGMIFHDTANNQFRSSLIIAHEDKATQNLFNMSKLFYEELPPIIRPMKKYSNESALSFENPTNDENEKYKNPGLRSKITVATAKNVQTARSNTYQNLHCSEVAFWQDATTLMTGLLQCVPDVENTMVLIESTANGLGGWFYDFWKRSERGETDYVPIFLPWFDNPDYARSFDSPAEKEAFKNTVDKIYVNDKSESIRTDEYHMMNRFKLTYEQLNWRRWCIANNCNGDVEKFHQEYPSTPDEAFISSGRPVFNITALRKYEEHCEEPIRTGYLQDVCGSTAFIDDDKGYIKIWKEPEPEGFYVLGADIAEGLVTGDYSCGVVLNDKYELCATWHGHIDPDLFGNELVKLARYYNDAYLGPESNNHGYTTIKSVLKQEYWNVYYQKNYSKITNDITQKPGWNTNRRTKPLMIDSLAEFIREMWLWMPNKDFVSEAYTYIKEDGGATNAQQGCHDDIIMATAIALQLLLEGRGENYAPETPNENKNDHKVFDGDKNEEDFNEEYVQIGFGNEEYSI